MTTNAQLWDDIEIALAHSPRVMLWGPPSTGKTYAAQHNATQSREVIEWTCTEGDTKETIFGGQGLKKGDTRFSDGIGTYAWKTGARLVLNEFDKLTYAPEMGAEGALYALADDPEFAQTRLDNEAHETIKPAPGFQLIATMNLRPDVLPEAVRSRFPVTIHVDDVNPHALDALPKGLRNHAHQYILQDEDKRIYLRQWLEMVRLIQEEKVEIETAARLVIGPGPAKDLADAMSVGGVTL